MKGPLVINLDWASCSCSKTSQQMTNALYDRRSLPKSKEHLHAAARLDASSGVAGLLRASAKALSLRPPSAASFKACSSSSVPENHTHTMSVWV